MKINTYDFIWNCYTPEQLVTVEDDARQFKNGVEFLYVIDTYDVVENFLPYTETDAFSNGDNNQLAQKFICYDFLFSHLDTTQVILANEYEMELVAVRSKLESQLKDAVTVLNNLKKLKAQTPDFSDENVTQEFLQKHFEIILLLLIMASKSNKIFEEFLSFTRHRLAITDIKLKTKDKEIVNQLFNLTKPTRLTIDIFNSFIDANKLFLVSISDDNERQIFLENTFRDIQVIERVMHINKQLKESGLKYYVIYLSTAKKTNSIFQCLKKMPSLATNNDVGFHRNIFQYFLKNKLQTEFEKEPDKMIRVLELMKEIRRRITENQDGDWNTNKETREAIDKMFSDASNSIDNHFYIKIFNEYKKEFSTAIDSKTLSIPTLDIKKILRAIEKSEANIRSNIDSLGYDLTQANQSFEVISLLTNLDRRIAKDVIQNAYQHIPILLFVTAGEKYNWKHELHDFVNELLELSKLDAIEKKERKMIAFQKLNRALAALQNVRTAKERITRSLCISYLSFVANNQSQNENDLIIEFESHLQLLKAHAISVDLNETNKSDRIKFRENDSELMVEVCYVLIWLYRRNGKHEMGRRMAEDFLTRFKGNARLLHGLGLCHLTVAYKSVDPDNVVDQLPDPENKRNRQVADKFDKAAGFLDDALKAYDAIDMSSINDATKSLILKTKTAILNSLANIKLRKYALGVGGFDGLESALGIMAKIQRLFVELNLSYEHHVTYTGTEIELLYFKARFYNENGDAAMARKYITDASLRLQKLSELEDFKFSDDFFKDRFKKVHELMSQTMLKR